MSNAITLTKRIEPDERYKEYLKQYSAFLGKHFSDKEIEVLDAIYWLGQGHITTETRKQIQTALDMSEFNLNNYLGKLRAKDCLERTTPEGRDEQLAPNLRVSINPQARDLIFYFTLQS